MLTDQHDNYLDYYTKMLEICYGGLDKPERPAISPCAQSRALIRSALQHLEIANEKIIEGDTATARSAIDTAIEKIEQVYDAVGIERVKNDISEGVPIHVCQDQMDQEEYTTT